MVKTAIFVLTASCDEQLGTVSSVKTLFNFLGGELLLSCFVAEFAPDMHGNCLICRESCKTAFTANQLNYI